MDVKSNNQNTTPKIEVVDERLLSVIKVKETCDIETVNKLVKDNWILIQVFKKENEYVFCLGKIRD